jgi:hypothetical protein
VSAVAIVIIIVVVVVVAAIAYFVLVTMRRRRLQGRFGAEYDRTVAEQPNRSAAERELRAREQKHSELDIKPLSSADQRRYQTEWTAVQAQFVDDPEAAVASADVLVTSVMRDRGYPTENFDERVETLSVDHSATLDHYRQAHDISLANQRGQASTEQLRQALVHYRALAEDLLGIKSGEASQPGRQSRTNEREAQ